MSGGMFVALLVIQLCAISIASDVAKIRKLLEERKGENDG